MLQVLQVPPRVAPPVVQVLGAGSNVQINSTTQAYFVDGKALLR